MNYQREDPAVTAEWEAAKEPAVPPQAITDGARALRKAGLPDNAGYIEGDEERAAQAVLEAAAQCIRADQREQDAQLAEQCGAAWLEPCSSDEPKHAMHSHHSRSFAEYLREQS